MTNLEFREIEAAFLVEEIEIVTNCCGSNINFFGQCAECGEHCEMVEIVE
jgi:hypothetical protein